MKLYMVEERFRYDDKKRSCIVAIFDTQEAATLEAVLLNEYPVSDGATYVADYPPLELNESAH